MSTYLNGKPIQSGGSFIPLPLQSNSIVVTDALGTTFNYQLLSSVIEGIKYAWPTSVERIDQCVNGNPSPMTDGELGVQRDTGDVYMYSGVFPTGSCSVLFNLQDGSLSGVETQETIAAEAITGVDKALVDQLDFAPKSALSVKLTLNGVHQKQGAGADYTVSGQVITWLQATGTAVPMKATDTLIAFYEK